MDAVMEPVAELPELTRVVGGVVGLVALGASAAVGAHGVLLDAIPSGLWVGGGALLLTAPALLVAHQFMGLSAAPERVMGALAETVARGGMLALGLVPFQAFFSFSTLRGPGLFALLLMGMGIAALMSAGRQLMDAEREAGAEGVPLLRARTLVMGWSLLTVLVGMRLAWAVL
jgi:hypothetical protein